MPTEIKIYFVGIILFMNVAGGRDVAVLDLSKGDKMHGHDIRPHKALIAVAPTDLDGDDQDWDGEDPAACESPKFRCFPLNGYALAMEGLQADPPLHITSEF